MEQEIDRKKMPFAWFVSFAHAQGFGSMVYHTTTGVETEEFISELNQYLQEASRRAGDGSIVTLLHYKRLETHEGGLH